MLNQPLLNYNKNIFIITSLFLNRFHQGEVTPEVTDVSEFMELLLNSCSEEVQNSDSDSPPDPKEVVFLVLRVLKTTQTSHRRFKFPIVCQNISLKWLFSPDWDCSLSSHLQVVGVMGRAMQDVSPSLISSVLKCAKKTDIPLSNQKAAIQAFRLMGINDEVRSHHTPWVIPEHFYNPSSEQDRTMCKMLIKRKKKS